MTVATGGEVHMALGRFLVDGDQFWACCILLARQHPGPQRDRIRPLSYIIFNCPIMRCHTFSLFRLNSEKVCSFRGCLALASRAFLEPFNVGFAVY